MTIPYLPVFCPYCGRRFGHVESSTRVCIRCRFHFDGVRCRNHHRHPFVAEADACSGTAA